MVFLILWFRESQLSCFRGAVLFKRSCLNKHKYYNCCCCRCFKTTLGRSSREGQAKSQGISFLSNLSHQLQSAQVHIHPPLHHGFKINLGAVKLSWRGQSKRPYLCLAEPGNQSGGALHPSATRLLITSPLGRGELSHWSAPVLLLRCHRDRREHQQLPSIICSIGDIFVGVERCISGSLTHI